LSHTQSHIFCKTRFSAGQEDFEFVERRTLVAGAAKDIRLLGYGDVMQANGIFEAMDSNFREELDGLWYARVNLDAFSSEISELLKRADSTDDSDEESSLMVEIDLLREDIRKMMDSISRVIDLINEDSKFNVDTRMIGGVKKQIKSPRMTA
jgi:hypothetical protein